MTRFSWYYTIIQPYVSSNFEDCSDDFPLYFSSGRWAENQDNKNLDVTWSIAWKMTWKMFGLLSLFCLIYDTMRQKPKTVFMLYAKHWSDDEQNSRTCCQVIQVVLTFWTSQGRHRKFASNLYLNRQSSSYFFEMRQNNTIIISLGTIMRMCLYNHFET